MMTWQQTRQNHWIARNCDGYQLKVIENDDMCRWTVRPPGAGYDVSSGSAQTIELAKLAAEAALQTLINEILARQTEALSFKRKKPAQ